MNKLIPAQQTIPSCFDFLFVLLSNDKGFQVTSTDCFINDFCSANSAVHPSCGSQLFKAWWKFLVLLWTHYRMTGKLNLAHTHKNPAIQGWLAPLDKQLGTVDCCHISDHWPRKAGPFPEVLRHKLVTKFWSVWWKKKKHHSVWLHITTMWLWVWNILSL